MSSQDDPKNQDLFDSIMMRDHSRVRESLNSGTDVNCRDQEHGETPLILAVLFAEVKTVHLLLEAGAEVNAQDDWGRTPIFDTSVSSEVFQVLRNAGADIHARDMEGNTILMRKVSESASVSDVEELLRLGIDPDVANEDGVTALDLANELGLVSVVERISGR